MEIYCTRAEVEGRVSGAGTKQGSYKKGSRKYEYAFDTVTITFTSGLSRSYIIDDDSSLYYDDDEIDYDELLELLGKKKIGDDAEDDEKTEKYLHIYGEAEVEYNDEYYVYPQAAIKELHMYSIMLEEAVISEINGEKVTVLDDEGREFEYKFADNARYYVDGKKKRLTDFKKAVRLNYSTVTIKYDNDGYITHMYAETK